MENFCDTMKPHEEVVIQRYIDKYAVFYGVFILVFYFTSVAYGIIPFLMQQPFPSMSEYPFDVSYEPLKTIIYLQHIIVAFIISGQLCLNIFMSLLLWFASARFEILIEELRTVTNVYQLIKCIKKHQEILT